MSEEPFDTEVAPADDDYAAIERYNARYNDCNCMAYDAEECVSVRQGYGPNVDVAMLYHEPCDCTCHEQYAKAKKS